MREERSPGFMHKTDSAWIGISTVVVTVELNNALCFLSSVYDGICQKDSPSFLPLCWRLSVDCGCIAQDLSSFCLVAGLLPVCHQCPCVSEQSLHGILPGPQALPKLSGSPTLAVQTLLPYLLCTFFHSLGLQFA